NGAIQVDLFSGPLLVPFGPTDGAGYASLAVIPPLAPANVPLAAQALVLDTLGPRVLVASNIASTSVYDCSQLSVHAVVSEASVVDDTGEYSMHIMRDDNSSDSAYYGLIRVARVQQGTQVIEEEILIESHPLDEEANLYIQGVIDLYPPEKFGDQKGDRLRVRLYDQPPTQDTVTQGCELFTSYC
ncbi:MAG: hypothetical protein JNM84_27765, partial [Planctomycetes bacterium]|nr:hypothetical protein [Planctomycetota bacterium]